MCKQLVVALALLMAGNFAKAQCLGSCCSAGSNTDITNHLLNGKKGDWQISTAYSIMEYRPFTNEQLLQWSTLENATFTVESQQSLKLAVQYNITDRLKVNASIPYNFSSDNREGHTHEGDHVEIHDYAGVQGLGDATVIGSYEWLGDDKKGWQFSTGLGIKAPTGQTEVLSSTNVGVPQHLQPGTGSWDPVATVNMKKQVKQWVFTGDVYGKLATTAKDHNMGDYLSGTASAFWKAWEKNDQLISSLVLVGALQSDLNSHMRMPMNHIHNGDTSSDAPLTVFDNSGFSRIFISGGTLVSLGKHFIIPFSISVPVYQHLNGYQVKMQWKSTLGLSLNF